MPLLSTTESAVRECEPVVAGEVVDISLLRQVVGDEADVVRYFLTEYLASAHTEAAALRAATASGDAGGAAMIAHRLKSSSRLIGALALGDLCDELESAGQAGAISALGLLRFERELAAVEACIGRTLHDGAKPARPAPCAERAP